MKIIGKSKDGLICTLSEGELATILGYYSEYNREVVKFIDSNGEINLGETLIKLHNVARINQDIVSAKNALARMVETLEELSKISMPINEIGQTLKQQS